MAQLLPTLYQGSLDQKKKKKKLTPNHLPWFFSQKKKKKKAKIIKGGFVENLVRTHCVSSGMEFRRIEKGVETGLKGKAV
jgi:hypothetical protein